jgi:hypothetical protein
MSAKTRLLLLIFFLGAAAETVRSRKRYPNGFRQVLPRNAAGFCQPRRSETHTANEQAPEVKGFYESCCRY